MPRHSVQAARVALTVLALLVSTVARAQNIQVTAANPNTGAQGTTALLVKISGKNFAPGARADFFLSGTTNPAGVTVRGTQWVSATEVDALIDIADAASLALFDIRVANTNGRSGKGSDMFQVVQKTAQSSCDASVLRANASLRLLPATRTPLACENGVLDCAYGVNGVAVRTLLDYALVQDSVLDQSGRLVVLAETHATGGSDGFAVLRFTPTGSIDTTFGTGGVARVAFSSGVNEFPQRLAVQRDGAVIVVGAVPSKPSSGSPRLAAVARFTNTGALDPTFGAGGKLTFSFDASRTSSWAFGVALQSDGRILVGGTADDDFAAARLLPNGAFDSSFGNGGRVRLQVGTGGSGSVPTHVGAIAIQNDGPSRRVVIAGNVVNCTVEEVAVVRLDATGHTDPAFGPTGDGRVLVDIAGGPETVRAAVIDSLQRIVIGGLANVSSRSFVLRLSADGRLDSSFAGGGAAALQFDNRYTQVVNLAIDGADRVLALGTAYAPGSTDSDAFAVRLSAEGAMDVSFASGGSLAVNYPVGNNQSKAGAAVVQPDGRIVFAGNAVFNYVVILGLLP